MSCTVFIRADAMTRMGTGHVMRCMALAQAWKDAGGEAVFLTNCGSEALRRRIAEEGFGLIPVEAPHPDAGDLALTLETLRKARAANPGSGTWLVIDGYHFDTAYQRAVREEGIRSVVVDDIAHLDRYHADILLNQNINAPSLDYACDADTLKLLGCGYALLRREFLRHAGWERPIVSKAARILVTLGGGDQDNVTLKVLRALNSLGDKDLEARIVVGPANPHRASLETALGESPRGFRLVEAPKEMPELMMWADFAVAAGGSTSWELAFLGLPSVTMVIADNQAGISRGLGIQGVALDLGWHADLTPAGIAGAVDGLLRDAEARRALSARGRRLVDGRGSRILEQAMCGAVA